MAVILSVINSNREVNIDVYELYCTETALLAKKLIDDNGTPWVKVTPTVHTVLAHSPQLIRENECKGLGNFNESGLESNHKYPRQFRANFSRKCSQFSNLSDCFRRLCFKRNPEIIKSSETFSM